MSEFLDELLMRNDPRVTERLATAVVGVAGCGGLGSNVAVALARVGARKLVLADSDCVETSNLNRQQFFLEDVGTPKVEALARRIKTFNPEIELETHQVRLDENSIFEIFAACDVVVEAFDCVPDKSMIMQCFGEERFADKCLVAGSGMAGIESANMVRTRKLARNIYVCGDCVTAPEDHRGLMAPRVMIAAGHQANMVLRILLGELEP